MTAPNTGIPYVPENTLDPAAGLNAAIDHIDALLQTRVISMALTTPPGTSSDGDLYIVAAPASGDWAGQAGNLARFVQEGLFWQFFTAGAQVRLVLNIADGQLYAFDQASSPGEWSAIAPGMVFQTDDSPVSVDSVQSVIVGDGLAIDFLTGGVGRLRALSGGFPVVNTASINTDATAAAAGRYTRFSNAAATYTFNPSAGFVVGQEYHGRYVGSGTLTLTAAGGMTLNAPVGASLVLAPRSNFRVKIVASGEADVLVDAA